MQRAGIPAMLVSRKFSPLKKTRQVVGVENISQTYLTFDSQAEKSSRMPRDDGRGAFNYMNIYQGNPPKADLLKRSSLATIPPLFFHNGRPSRDATSTPGAFYQRPLLRALKSRDFSSRCFFSARRSAASSRRYRD